MGNKGFGGALGQNGGGAIFLFEAAAFNLYNCTLRNNTGGVRGLAMGGALLAQASQAYIRNSIFSGNLATVVSTMRSLTEEMDLKSTMQSCHKGHEG